MIEDNRIKEQIASLERKIIWLENRYSQAMTAIADTIEDTLPLNLQQKFYLKLSKRLEALKSADLTRKN